MAIGGEGADELFGGYPRYAWLGRAPSSGPGTVGGAALRRADPAGKADQPRRRGERSTCGPAPARRAAPRLGDGRAAPRARRPLRAAAAGRLRADDRVLASVRTDVASSRSYSVAGALMQPRPGQLASRRRPRQGRPGRDAGLAGAAHPLPATGAGRVRRSASRPRSTSPVVASSCCGCLLSELLPHAPQRRKAAFLPPIAAWLRGPAGGDDGGPDRLAARSTRGLDPRRRRHPAARRAPPRPRRPQRPALAACWPPASGWTGFAAGAGELMRTLVLTPDFPPAPGRDPAARPPPRHQRPGPALPGRHPRRPGRGRVRPRRRDRRQAGAAAAGAAPGCRRGAERGGAGRGALLPPAGRAQRAPGDEPGGGR